MNKGNHNKQIQIIEISPIENIYSWDEIAFDETFYNHSFQIMEVVGDDLSKKNIRFIEKLIVSFLSGEARDNKSFFIHNFSFDRSLRKRFAIFDELDDTEKQKSFYDLFMISFKKFMISKSYLNLPNIKNAVLVAYLQNDIVKFRFEYKKGSVGESSIEDVINYGKLSLRYLMSGYEKKDEIEQEIEYNEYILDEMFDLLDFIDENPNIKFASLKKKGFSKAILEINEFLENNENQIGFLMTNNPYMIAFFKLFILIIKNSDTTIGEFEENIKKEFGDTDDFYDSTKDVLSKFINDLNKMLKIKKAS